MRPDNDPLAMVARASFLIAVIAISFASLAPAGWLPHVLYSYHLEHFAAFYLVTLAMAAARSRTAAYRLLIDACILASVLEAARLLIPSHQLNAAEDWVSDVGGALAALAPTAIGEFRTTFRPPPSAAGRDIIAARIAAQPIAPDEAP
jgi:hypothetical protein